MKKGEDLVLLAQNRVDALDIILRIFGVMIAGKLFLRQIDFVHAAAPEGEDGVQLFHHVYVIKPGIARLAPADVFKAAGHVLLPVEIVGCKAVRAERPLRVLQHPGHVRLTGQYNTPLEQIRALFQRQRVYRDVARPEGHDLTQRIGEAVRRVGGQARDEIHVDIVKPGLVRLMEHVHDGRRAVPPPDGL